MASADIPLFSIPLHTLSYSKHIQVSKTKLLDAWVAMQLDACMITTF